MKHGFNQLLLSYHVFWIVVKHRFKWQIIKSWVLYPTLDLINGKYAYKLMENEETDPNRSPKSSQPVLVTEYKIK